MSNGRAVVVTNVTSMRKTDETNSEQISQALFGETVELLEDLGDFNLIKTPDGYTGVVRSSSIVILETGENYPAPNRAAMVTSLIQPVFERPTQRSERVTLLTIGSTVEIGEIDEQTGFTRIVMPNRSVAYIESSALIVPEYPSPEFLGPNLTLIARAFVGIPYLWGGRSSFGIDCSGFVQRIFWLCGYILPRDAYVQAADFRFVEVDKCEIRSGDLLFFKGDRDPNQRGITHVGMAQEDGRFIHASGELGVAITPIDQPPYDRQLVCVKRFNV